MQPIHLFIPASFSLCMQTQKGTIESLFDFCGYSKKMFYEKLNRFEVVYFRYAEDKSRATQQGPGESFFFYYGEKRECNPWR